MVHTIIENVMFFLIGVWVFCSFGTVVLRILAAFGYHGPVCCDPYCTNKHHLKKRNAHV